MSTSEEEAVKKNLQVVKDAYQYLQSKSYPTGSSDNAVVGLPHVTKIARKPEGVGTEYRTLSCGETKIMLQLEIQEGKVPMQGKEYANDYGSGTSSLLWFTRYWSG